MERDPPPPAPPPAPNKAFPYQPPCRLTFASKVTQCSIGGPFSMEDGGIRLYRLRNFQVQPTHRVIGICGYGHWCVMCVFFETRVNHQLMAYSLHWSLWVHQLIDWLVDFPFHYSPFPSLKAMMGFTKIFNFAYILTNDYIVLCIYTCKFCKLNEAIKLILVSCLKHCFGHLFRFLCFHQLLLIATEYLVGYMAHILFIAPTNNEHTSCLHILSCT